MTLSASSGSAGSALTLVGTNFGSTQVTSIVTIGGDAAAVTSWSNTSISIIVPPQLSLGTYTVQLAIDNVAIADAQFSIVPVSISVSCSPATVNWNSQVTCTATLTTTTGSITFLDSGQPLGTVQLPTKAITYTALSVGAFHKITAVYYGYDEDLGPESAPFAQTVIIGSGTTACPAN
jgi:hypothetical protein